MRVRGPLSTRLRCLIAAALAALYALGSHALMLQADNSALALFIVLGPFVGLGIAGLWGGGQRLAAVLCTVLAAVVAGLVLGGHAISSRWLYLAQHAGVHLALGAWFAGTLRGGREPMITAVARRVHTSLTPAMAHYTRQVTLAWTGYFFGMAAVSLGLFTLGDFRHWSLLANLLTPVLIAALFVIEYLLRYRLHPEFERVSFATAFRAWQAHRAEAS